MNKPINPEVLASAITAIGIRLAKNKSSDVLDLLSAAFMQLADVLSTISTARNLQNDDTAPQK